MIKETDQPSSEPIFPVSYDKVIKEHPLIPTALYSLRSKREFRDEEWDAGRWSEHNRDSTVNGFIGMGDEKATLGVDGLAIKVLHERPNTHYSFDDQVAHLKRGEGVECLEQLVTGNRNEGVIITELMAGKSIAAISALKLTRLVKPEHIARLEETLSAMRERELDFDNVGNILFDPTEGFNFVDYRFITYKGRPIGSDEEPSSNENNRKRQEEMSVETILHLAATMRRYTSNGIHNEYGELSSSHGQRSPLGKLALKAAFSRFQK
jgi:hypothetical protein